MPEKEPFRRRKPLDPRRGLPESARIEVEEQMRVEISKQLSKTSVPYRKATQKYFDAVTARETKKRNPSEFYQTNAQLRIARALLTLLQRERAHKQAVLLARSRCPYLFSDSAEELQKRVRELPAEIRKLEKTVALLARDKEINEFAWNKSWHKLKTGVHAPERKELEKAVEQAQKERTRIAISAQRISLTLATQIKEGRLSLMDARKKLVPIHLQLFEKEIPLARAELQLLQFWLRTAEKGFLPKEFRTELAIRIVAKAGELFAAIKMRDMLKAELEKQGKD